MQVRRGRLHTPCVRITAQCNYAMPPRPMYKACRDRQGRSSKPCPAVRLTADCVMPLGSYSVIDRLTIGPGRWRMGDSVLAGRVAVERLPGRVHEVPYRTPHEQGGAQPFGK